MSKKYYLGTVSETNGGFDYDTPYVFSTAGDPDRYSDKVTKNWRGKLDYDSTYGGYWCDSTLITDAGSNEVPKQDFDVLKKYLANL